MGHYNPPIEPSEPSDWSDGPKECPPLCETCYGDGIVVNDFNKEVTCPDCVGTGYIDTTDIE